MNRSSSELKGIARETLQGHYSIPVAAFFMIQLAVMIITFTYTNLFGTTLIGTTSLMIFYAGLLIISLLSCLAQAGYSWLLMNLSRGRSYQLGDIIYPFGHQGDKILITTIMKGLLGFLCLLPALVSLFFVMLYPHQVLLRLLVLVLLLAGLVGCVMIDLTYSLTSYICLDIPELTAAEVMKTSRDMMHGHCFRLFYLEISFLGLILLSILSCYIGFLWLYPYMETTKIQSINT